MPGSGSRLTKLTAAMVLGLIASLQRSISPRLAVRAVAVSAAVARAPIRRQRRRVLHLTMLRRWNVL